VYANFSNIFLSIANIETVYLKEISFKLNAVYYFTAYAAVIFEISVLKLVAKLFTLTQL
jgi:hypothetical protein